ncbi:MAG: hypothetical protein OEV87_04235 [Phycisphaerae bacterium]|nr:hypothetical protein [Phycisphaerae bacterium]
MRRVKRKKQNKGAILALMVMVVLLLSMTSLALIRVGTEARLRTVKSASQISARFAADAGIERVLYLMNKQLEAGTWTLDNVPTYSAQALTASNADYTVTFTGNLTSGYQITSVGHNGNQTKTVRATVALTSPIAEDFAIFCRNALALKSKCTVGGFNSSDPSDTDVDTKIGTQSAGNDAIDIKSDTDIDADIFIGPGGDPDTVIKSKDQLNIDGEVFIMPTEFYLPPVAPPDYTASKGSISGNNVTLNTPDSGKYTEISISNDGTLTIDSDVTLYVTGDIDLKNNTEVEIKNNATLELYFDGDINANNSSGINNESEIPSNVKIYGTGTNQKIDLKNSADLYAVVYAPNADMTVNNGGEAYGSFITESFELKNSGQVYYDEALKQVAEDDKLVRFTVTRWEET